MQMQHSYRHCEFVKYVHCTAKVGDNARRFGLKSKAGKLNLDSVNPCLALSSWQVFTSSFGIFFMTLCSPSKISSNFEPEIQLKTHQYRDVLNNLQDYGLWSTFRLLAGLGWFVAELSWWRKVRVVSGKRGTASREEGALSQRLEDVFGPRLAICLALDRRHASCVQRNVNITVYQLVTLQTGENVKK